jgi:hypothetical protein
MTLTIHDARNGARHLACDSCGWRTGTLTCTPVPNQVWHAFELDHDDAASGCTAIVSDPRLRARYDEAFMAWSMTNSESALTSIPLARQLQLAS